MKDDKATEAEPMANPKTTGRPSDFSVETAETLCERMAEGKGLREVCTLDGMPDRSTVLRWLEANADFRGQYARARMHCMDWYAEEILKIAFDESGDIIIDQDGDKSRTVVNHAKIQRDKLKVDTLKWIMSKLAARRYGVAPEELAPAELHPITKIELVGVRPDETVVRWENIERRIVRPGDIEGENIAAEPEGPRMLTYQPAPPPADLRPDEWATINRVLAMIPNDSDASAAEVFGVIEAAIEKHFAAQRAEIAN